MGNSRLEHHEDGAELKAPSSPTSGEMTAPHSEMDLLPMGPCWEPAAMLGALTLGFFLAHPMHPTAPVCGIGVAGSALAARSDGARGAAPSPFLCSESQS